MCAHLEMLLLRYIISYKIYLTYIHTTTSVVVHMLSDKIARIIRFTITAPKTDNEIRFFSDSINIYVFCFMDIVMQQVDENR